MYWLESIVWYGDDYFTGICAHLFESYELLIVGYRIDIGGTEEYR